MPDPIGTPKERSRVRGCLKWGVLAVVLISSIGYLALVPIVEMTLRSIGSVVTGFTLGFEKVLTHCYEVTRQEVSESLEVGMLLGHPIECAPFEEVDWSAAKEGQLELSFEVNGPLGGGRAHALVSLSQDGAEIENLSVVTSEGVTILRP